MKTVANLSPSYEQVQDSVNKRVRLAGIIAAVVSLTGIIAIFMR